MSIEVFGALYDAGELEAAATAQLRRWLPTYLSEVVEQKEHAAIAEPVSWGVASEYDRFPEQGLPALIIAVQGTEADSIVRAGDGAYRAEWEVEVDVTLAAASGAAARRMAQLYGAAIRGVMLKHPQLDERSIVVDWGGEFLGNVSADKRRTQVACANTFRVRSDAVVLATAGPAEPPGPDAWPEITDVDLEVSP